MSRGLAINYATVLSELQQRSEYSRVGTLSELYEGLPALRDLESFCRIIRELAQRRRLYLDLESIQSRVLDRDPLEEIAADANRALSSIDNRHNSISIDSLKSVCAFSLEGIEFVVDGLIAAGSVTAITGDSGTGKSTFSSALAGGVAYGEPFIGRLCSRRNVLILDRENPASVVKERFGRLGIQDGGDIRVWGAWQPHEVPEPGSPAVLRWVAETNPKPLIIVDSFIAFLSGGDENDASVVRSFMQQLRRLADLGATVIVLHHTGKGESTRDYRGSSDFKASLDVGFSLVNMGDRMLERLRLKAFKTRFIVDADLIVNYSGGQFLADDRPNAADRTVTERLTQLLRENPGIHTSDFETLAADPKRNLGRDRARQFLRNGQATGDIRQERGTKNARANFLVDRSGGADQC